MNSFKQKFKEKYKKKQGDLSVLAYKLPKKTELTPEVIGKYGVLGNEKFEKEIDEDER